MLRLGFDRIVDGRPIPNGPPEAYLPFLGRLLEKEPVEVREVAALLGSRDPWAYIVVPSNYWGRWFKGGITELAPEAVLEDVRHRQCWLLVYNANEGFGLTDDVFERMHDALRSARVPARRVIFVSGNVLLEGLYERWFATTAYEEKIAVLAWSAFEHHSAWWCQWKPADYVRAEELSANPPRDRRYLSFMRRPHIVRFATLLHLHDRNLLDHGLVSFPAKAGWPEFYPSSVSPLIPEAHPDYTRLMRHADEIQTKLPLHVDVSNLAIDLTYRSDHAWPYLRTYVSLVSETFFDDPRTLFVTEKTFKRMANLHPFIMLAVPHTLSLLRQMGYSTFEDLWDESYDAIEDPFVRFSAVMRLVDEICAMPERELADLVVRARPALLHNKQHLLAARDRGQLHIAALIEKMA